MIFNFKFSAVAKNTAVFSSYGFTMPDFPLTLSTCSIMHKMITKYWLDCVTRTLCYAYVMVFAAVCHTPQAVEAREDSVPITMVCDNVRDPANMGTLLRTASAVGCERILVAKGIL